MVITFESVKSVKAGCGPGSLLYKVGVKVRVKGDEMFLGLRRFGQKSKWETAIM